MSEQSFEEAFDKESGRKRKIESIDDAGDNVTKQKKLQKVKSGDKTKGRVNKKKKKKDEMNSVELVEYFKYNDLEYGRITKNMNDGFYTPFGVHGKNWLVFRAGTKDNTYQSWGFSENRNKKGQLNGNDIGIVRLLAGESGPMTGILTLQFRDFDDPLYKTCVKVQKSYIDHINENTKKKIDKIKELNQQNIEKKGKSIITFFF